MNGGGGACLPWSLATIGVSEDLRPANSGSSRDALMARGQTRLTMVRLGFGGYDARTVHRELLTV